MSNDRVVDNAIAGPPRGGSPEPTFSGVASFMRRPLAKTFAGADVVVWGVPFDMATSNRPGARFGPAAIRERLGDGNFAGRYQREDDEMFAIWRVAVEEARALLDTGWA